MTEIGRASGGGSLMAYCVGSLRAAARRKIADQIPAAYHLKPSQL